jgi:hypothetical protein
MQQTHVMKSQILVNIISLLRISSGDLFCWPEGSEHVSEVLCELRTNEYASDRLKRNICSPSKFLKIFALSDLECTIYLVYSLWDSSFLSVAF